MKNAIVTLAIGLSLLVSQSVNAQIVQNIPNPPVSGEPVQNCINRHSAILNQILSKIPAHLRKTNRKAIAARLQWNKSVRQCVAASNK